jgi:hypothetical protein
MALAFGGYLAGKMEMVERMVNITELEKLLI